MLLLGRIGCLDSESGRLFLSWSVAFLVASIIPRERSVSVSVVQSASYSNSMSTQCGGYLKRAVSSRSTFLACRSKPPIGQKCPSPVWLNTLREMLQIDWKPSVCDVASIAVLNRLKSHDWMYALLVLWWIKKSSGSSLDSVWCPQQSWDEWTWSEWEWSITSFERRVCFNGSSFGLKVMVLRPLHLASYVSCSKDIPFSIASAFVQWSTSSEYHRQIPFHVLFGSTFRALRTMIKLAGPQ